MKIKWGWDDGYVGRRPEKTLEIDDEDIEGLSDAERDTFIDECVVDEMHNHVHLYWRIEEGK